jgi:hypothetical protein
LLFKTKQFFAQKWDKTVIIALTRAMTNLQNRSSAGSRFGLADEEWKINKNQKIPGSLHSPAKVGKSYC